MAGIKSAEQLLIAIPRSGERAAWVKRGVIPDFIRDPFVVEVLGSSPRMTGEPTVFYTGTSL
ncbi:hypothetical protein XM53_15590 [Roseovarius atlanticus]|uniref:Uncharacterized protein n=1 Tax=Roseovarius atlanticus TaxID=1641875 RepID=A0A0T5NRP0_9RHOB|nr:hypothetical protein XM53_15590 [Roseovarius atlanticus]